MRGAGKCPVARDKTTYFYRDMRCFLIPDPLGITVDLIKTKNILGVLLEKTGNFYGFFCLRIVTILIHVVTGETSVVFLIVPHVFYGIIF